MTRTSSASVQGILADNYDGSTSLTPFIASATAVVDRVSSLATDYGYSLSATELELIERWLSAHFYCAADPLFAEKQTGEARGKYQGRERFIDDLSSTDYGRRAKMLDPSGALASLAEGTILVPVWLGKVPSGQTDYVDRD